MRALSTALLAGVFALASCGDSSTPVDPCGGCPGGTICNTATGNCSGGDLGGDGLTFADSRQPADGQPPRHDGGPDGRTQDGPAGEQGVAPDGLVDDAMMRDNGAVDGNRVDQSSPQDIGAGGCQNHAACPAGEVCVNRSCIAPASCAALLEARPSTPSGKYEIRLSPAASKLKVGCDMETDGGGWTLFLRCSKGDSCSSSNGVPLHNTNWTADFNEQATGDNNTSYLLGQSLAPLVQQDGQFMLKITDTQQNQSGAVVYPLSADTRPFFDATDRFESAPQTITVVAEDQGVTYHSARICWESLSNSGTSNTHYARSFQGEFGLRILGLSSNRPSATANATCDFGPWGAQILLRHPSRSSFNTMWGMSAVTTWADQDYSHRIYIRERVPTIHIVNSGTGRRWSDGSYARTCRGYRSPGAAHRSYSGTVGSGVYTVMPLNGTAPIDVYCDMETDGGGWALIQRTVWDWNLSQALHTNYADLYDKTVGTTDSAYRLAAKHWQGLAAQKELLATFHSRKVKDGSSCEPLSYKVTGLNLAVAPALKLLSASNYVQPAKILESPVLSTTNSGPSQSRACVTTSQGVPWFYGQCCSTCPTFKGTHWVDNPHPMVSFIEATSDLAGRTTTDACGGDAPIKSARAGGYVGLNAMEFFLR